MREFHEGEIFAIARRQDADPAEFIDFSASVNPLGPAPKAKKKISRDPFSAILRYPDPQCFELRRALAQYSGVSEGQILPGAGSMGFIFQVPRVLKIKKALLVTPACGDYEKALEKNGSDCRIHFFETREEDGFELNVEGLLLALTQGYDALYICNPNHMTGILTEKRDLLRVLARTEEEKIWFILDETSIDFLPRESLADQGGSTSRLLILRSMANFFALPGLRAGYLISNQGLVENFSEDQDPFTVNGPAQTAAVASLEDHVHMERTRGWIRKEREFVIQGLRSIPGFIPYPGAANYLLVQLHPSLRIISTELKEKLILRKILIRDADSSPPLGPFFFRISIRQRKENQTLLKALRQVQQEIVADLKNPRELPIKGEDVVLPEKVLSAKP